LFAWAAACAAEPAARNDAHRQIKGSRPKRKMSLDVARAAKPAESEAQPATVLG
jgi:hypothetical protein